MTDLEKCKVWNVQKGLSKSWHLNHPYIGVGGSGCHHLSPHSVHGLVALALHGELSVDVLRGEDGLKIEPGPLTHDPLLHHVL